MIHQLSIKNFKSLYDITAELKPLTIIIGPNASGKSNLLDALETVQRLVTFKGTVGVSFERGRQQPVIFMDEVLWRRAEPTAEIFWKLDCSLPSGEDLAKPESYRQAENTHLIVYELAVKNAGEQELPIISQEKLIADWSPILSQHEYLSRYERNVSVLKLANNSLEQEKTDISLTDLALHYYARPPFPVITSFRDYVQQWQFHKIIPEIIRSPRSALVVGGKHQWLEKHGENLAHVLHYLHDKKPADFDYIQAEMYSILGFSQLYTREEEIDEELRAYLPPARVHLEMQEERFGDLRPFGPDNLSDGTLGLLALLTVLAVSDPAPLICLEEPELSTHPQLLRRLAYYLREAAQHTQVILTTHSAELLDHFDPYEQEYLQILIAYRDQEGATQFVPIRNVQRVKEWLEDYMLGQIWTMGQIEEMLEVE